MPVKLTEERINEILNSSEVVVSTVYDKCTIVAIRLPNGFVIVEHAACADPDEYSEQTGYEICMNNIVGKLYELEGYKAHGDSNESH